MESPPTHVLGRLIALSLVERIRVESLVRDDMVLQEGGEVLLSTTAEEEGVDAGAELLECVIGGGEEGTTGVRRVFELVKETGLLEGELKGAEFSGKELNNLERRWGWDQEVVDAVDHTVGCELYDS